jgi:hypothetical protein
MRITLSPRRHWDDQERSILRGRHIEGRFLSHPVSVIFKYDNGRHRFLLNQNSSGASIQDEERDGDLAREVPIYMYDVTIVEDSESFMERAKNGGCIRLGE